MQKKVIVVGGGFGGVYTAKNLLRFGFQVTLISDYNYFTFTPLLHEVATGGLNASDIVFDFNTFFHNPKFNFIKGHVDKIDYEKHEVRVDNRYFSADYIVVATGAKTRKFNITGTENALELKTITDAKNIKKQIINLADTKDSFVITTIGAGPTGIELITEIKDLIDDLHKSGKKFVCFLQIINHSDTILGSFSEQIQRYTSKVLQDKNIKLLNSTKVVSIEPDFVIVNEGEKLESDITILVAGVSPDTDCITSECLHETGHVEVNDFLQTKKNPNIFALGDIIMQNGEIMPKLAQTAVVQAGVVAKNINNLASEKNLVKYTLKVKGLLISLGSGAGAGSTHDRIITGPAAWFVWRTVYLFKTPGIGNKLKVAFSWTLHLFTKRSLVEE